MRKLIARLATLPQYSKNDNFTLALVDYLYNELKLNGISARREKSYVKVALSNKYEDKYEHIIIDCCDGKMYLRGKDCRDKRWGRLSKFNQKRKADAYVCANYNARRIINRIKKLEDKMMNKLEEIQVNKFSIASTDIDEKLKYFLDGIDDEIVEENPDEIIFLDDNTEAYPYYELDENDVAEEYPLIDLDNCDEEIDSYPYYELDEEDVVEEYPYYDLDNCGEDFIVYIFNPMEKETMDELVNDLVSENYIDLDEEDVVEEYPYYELDDDVESYPYYELDENDVAEEYYPYYELSEDEVEEEFPLIDLDKEEKTATADAEKPLDVFSAKMGSKECQQVYEEYINNFFKSNALKNYLENNSIRESLQYDIFGLLEKVTNGNYKTDIAKNICNALNIDSSNSEIINGMVEYTDMDFEQYVSKDYEKYSKLLFEAVKSNLTEFVGDFAKKLKENNDVVGRKIEIKNIDQIDNVNREKPFLYIDGKFYFGKNGQTHNDILRDQLGMDVEGQSRADTKTLTNGKAFGHGHISQGIAFIDDTTDGCKPEEIAQAIVKSGEVEKAYTSPYKGDRYITRLANNRLALVCGEDK